jgi:signal transduction histidine kinase
MEAGAHCAGVLSDFVAKNRDAIIAGTRTRVAKRAWPAPNQLELENGIPVFLDQLGDALRRAETSEETDHEQISRSAGQHGLDQLRMGLTIGQVVHDYGDVCQTITGLAVAQKVPISTEEFKTLNLCLDDAIAEAVTEFSRLRERTIAEQETERLGFLAHEQRNLLNTAMLAFEMIKTGRVAVGGSTGLVLGRSLLGIRDLIDRSLTDVRLDAGLERHDLICVAELVDEIEIGASLQAQVRRMQFSATSVDHTVTIEGDRQIIAAVVANLLQNAFKFTRQNGAVVLAVRATADRVLFEVEDECGGLPPGKSEDLFRSFSQHGQDRSGLGLGLFICRKAAHASAGEIYVRDVPGKGCVFTLDLPRRPPPPLSVVPRDDSRAAGSG